MKIRRLAIANRGEVAVRIIHACEELGIETILLHSEADVRTRAYRMANKRVCIGAAPTAKSYLNIQNNIQGAKAAGADAIHPGFGFLSENADFAEACHKAGLQFVGPSATAIRKLGDKVQAKELAKSLGLPLVPGYQGEDQSIDRLVREAEAIGFPVIVKAAAGGGGRGMKILRSKAEASELIQSAQREAQSAFGSSKVFLEKYLDRAKHIEFQIFGDSTGKVVHFFDRECSVQRRHQKIIEESLSPSLDDDLRRQMGAAACAIAEAAKYQSAGTVEFLLQDGKFYLLEVNTRLQVEHPVTELVMGVDLVKAQLRVAQQEPVFNERDVYVPRGHALECRLYAEDPERGGIPSIGPLGTVRFPEGPGRRFDFGFESGDEVTEFYDSMIAKIIVWDESRPRALQKMLKVLDDTVIFGVKTNIPLLKRIVSHPEFVKGTMTTRFMDQHFADPIKPEALSEKDEALVRQLAQKTPKGLLVNESPRESVTPFISFWRGV